MDFWRISVMAGKRERLTFEKGTILMLSEASLCAPKQINKLKGNQPISLFAEVGDRNLVLGSFSTENIRTMYFRHSFQEEEEIKLSHNWPHGTVKFRGYKLNPSSKTEEVKDLFFQVLSRFHVEIYLEILSRLPVECLLRCKRVCKLWYSLIEENYFVYKHLDTTELVAIHTEHAEREVYVYAGLILEKNKLSGRYQIRNPTIRRILDLPDPPKGLSLPIVCGNIDKLAVVALYNEQADNNTTEACAILKIGKDCQWRLLKLPNSEEWGNVVKGTLLSPDEGVTYYVTLNEDGLNYNMYVYALDLENESFFTTILPDGIFSNLRKATPLCCNNWLGICEVVKEQLKLILLEDYKNPQWIQTIIPLNFLKGNDYWKDAGDLNLCFVDSGELHFSYKQKYFTYNMVLGKITSERPKTTKLCCRIRPSLITLSGMRPE